MSSIHNLKTVLLHEIMVVMRIVYLRLILVNKVLFSLVKSFGCYCVKGVLELSTNILNHVSRDINQTEESQ